MSLSQLPKTHLIHPYLSTSLSFSLSLPIPKTHLIHLSKTEPYQLGVIIHIRSLLQREEAILGMAEEVSANKKKVMVAIDESECSHYALEWALGNLPDCIGSSAPLIVFTVQPINSTGLISVASLGSASLELIKSVQEQQKKISLTLLERAKEICSKHGVVAETITEVGDPKEATCEAVEKFKIDLLILGSHGRSALQRAFLGSVSNYCVHHAKCPVLVVKKQT